MIRFPDIIRRSSTARHIRFWKTRPIDWVKDYLSTWNHPHRQLIIDEIRRQPFVSVCELGCASGPNLLAIKKHYPNVQVGGADVSEEAIATAQKAFPDGIFHPAPADKTFFPDKCADVVLTDMAMIYVDPSRIRRTIREMKRIARKRIILCEFHSTSFFARLALRLAAGYHAYDWPRRLTEAGLYDVVIKKIPESAWPGGEPQKTFGYIITANV